MKSFMSLQMLAIWYNLVKCCTFCRIYIFCSNTIFQAFAKIAYLAQFVHFTHTLQRQYFLGQVQFHHHHHHQKQSSCWTSWASSSSSPSWWWWSSTWWPSWWWSTSSSTSWWSWWCRVRTAHSTAAQAGAAEEMEIRVTGDHHHEWLWWSWLIIMTMMGIIMMIMIIMMTLVISIEFSFRGLLCKSTHGEIYTCSCSFMGALWSI